MCVSSKSLSLSRDNGKEPKESFDGMHARDCSTKELRKVQLEIANGYSHGLAILLLLLTDAFWILDGLMNLLNDP